LTTSIDDRGTPLSYPETAPPRRALGAALKRALFGISPDEASFALRGFHAGVGDDAVRERLEAVGRCFVTGYNLALEESGAAAVAARIDAEIDRELHGFAYEGSGMALALLDTLIPPLPGRPRDRLARFLAGPGDAHAYIVNVGAGWLLARLPLSPERLLARLDPLDGWLALDGYGFHEGFFHGPRAVSLREVPGKLRGYARRGFDQGLGRSLWFVEGADVERIPRTIATFPADRRPDLWGGVGLATAYAGGRSQAEIEELRRAAGPCVPEVAQGVAFAAKARERAGNPAAHTELAARTICGTSAAQAAAVTDQAREGLPADRPGEPAFEVWRRRIQDRFRKGV
jgi:hypothetical protein